ncbi:MAG TPA: M28 family peptidase [Planctomycetota bacterium]|nr:M28 family peptidase [Planctomycetota bacterium]
MTIPFLITATLAGAISQGLASPSQPPPTAAAALAGELALVAGVDEARAQRHVRELVKLGPRMGGTSSGERAAAWLERAFSAAGLSVEVFEDSPRWCHGDESWKVTLISGPEQEVLTGAWPWGFSPASSGEAPLTLELTSATPQALLATRPPARQRRGAASDTSAPTPAVVLVDGDTTLDGAYPVLQHLRAGGDNPYPVFGISRPTGQRLRAALASGAQVALRWSLETTIKRAAPRTVVASIPAREPAADAPQAAAERRGHILFCAHGESDAGGPGAADNASGEAVLLEIASSWAAAIRAGKAPAPAREVRFAVWGSEIHSSGDYRKRCEKNGQTILAVINYDQAGYGSGADQLNLEPDDLAANVPLIRACLAVLADYRGHAGFPARWATNKSLGGTDSYVFSSSRSFRRGARPALTLFTSAWGRPETHPRTAGMPGHSWEDNDRVTVDYDNYYHSAGDTPENTTDREPWNMGWCARVGLLGAQRWLETLP